MLGQVLQVLLKLAGGQGDEVKAAQTLGHVLWLI